MAARYVNVTIDQIDGFLVEKGFKIIHPKNTVETVYGKRVQQGEFQLTLRVYTGINPDGNSRAVGKDAMRVALFLRRETDWEIVEVGGSKRVNRVQNWRKNLGERIDGWLEYMPTEKCEKCGLPMVVRPSKYGPFHACSGFPLCENRKSARKRKT